MKTIKNIVLQAMQVAILILLSIGASAQMKAGFNPSATSGCTPLFISFQNTSTGNGLSYKWDLGNGITSTNTNPSTTYIIPGTFAVKLVITSATGIDSIQQTIVVYPTPSVQFSASDTTGCYPLKVQFTDKSVAGSGTITSWQWDFGSGALSTQSNPLYTYTSAGANTVTLRVVNSNGCFNMATKNAYIKILNGVKADFAFTSGQGCSTPSSVSFTNNSSGTGALSYLWNFGDGNTSTSANPVHTYLNGGSYTVSLIVSNGVGCTDTIVKPGAINIGFVQALMSLPDTVCKGKSFTATNISNPSTFIGTFWDFGDGTKLSGSSVTQTYNATGTFTVKMRSDFGSCSDSLRKTITVVPSPAASFSANNRVACKAPLTVTFTNTSTGGQTYLWDFGDGTTSTSLNPVHTYNTSGMFTVTLTVKNAGGCIDDTVRQNFVQIIPPKLTGIKSLPIKACLPLTISPVPALADSTAIISAYLWNFGDGSTSTSATPSHTYTVAGVYSVSVIITTAPGCTDTLKVDSAVNVGVRPHVKFSGTPRDICAYMPVTFSDSTTPVPVHEWLWQFGDGGTSTDQNPVYNYNDTGYFSVTLIAYNFGCSDTLKVDSFIHVRPPIAQFDTSFLCSDPLRRKFVDKSIGANTYLWSFGDNSTSTLSSPSHVYASPGSYIVSLKVTNGGCDHTTTKTVVVVNEKGKLSISDSAVCKNAVFTMSVDNVNTANIQSYIYYVYGLGAWQLKGRSNPTTFSYSTPGVQNIAVSITDILNCRDTFYAAVPVHSYGPSAAFGSLQHNTCYGNTINFIDSCKSDGIHPVVEWVWNYGDGSPQSYSSGPFSHNYSSIGLFDVSVVIKDSYGCKDSIIKPSYVSLTKPVAKFMTSDTMLCPSSTVIFTNQSQASDAVYSWDFGDSQTSLDLSPTHSYSTIGTYTVKLVITDRNGCKDSSSVKIKVYPAKAMFTLSDTFTTCPPLVVSINNLSTYSQLHWDFGDGNASLDSTPSHIYTYPGSYNISLVVKNNGGCTDSITKKVVIQGPTGNFGYLPKKVCNPGVINYTVVSNNASRYVFDFADGTTYDTTSNSVQYTYLIPGVYIPKIILVNSAGCKVPVIGNDTIKVIGIETNILSNSTVLCDSGSISFRDSTISNDLPVGVMWDFGDGKTSSSANPSHTYTQPGLYTIRLVAQSDFGCKDTATHQSLVHIISSPKIVMGGDTSGCEPAQLQFAGLLSQPDTSALAWSWVLSNGTTSSAQQPPLQLFNSAGSYPVSVSVTNRYGCHDSISRSIIIHPKPVIEAGPDTTICKATPYILNPAGGVGYTWTGDSSMSCTTCPNPVVKPNVTTTYHVTGASPFGCKASDSLTVKILQPFKMTADRTTPVCAGRPVPLKASGADNYQWIPSTYLNNSTIGDPVSTPASDITYKVIGTDKRGCFKDSGIVKVTVHPIPTVQITNGEKISLQVGGTAQLNTTTTGDVIQYDWSPSQWLSCNSCPNPITTPKNNITYDVTVTNAGKCVATDKITVNMICNDANIFIPNSFSPNGDGVNDIFYPRGNGIFSVKSFRVFNRWGQIVFEKTNIAANIPTEGWNGKLNGLDQPTDVYVYLMEVVCSNNTVFPFKGNITLLR